MNDNYIIVQSDDISMMPESYTESMASKRILVERPAMTVNGLHQQGVYDPPVPLTCEKTLRRQVDTLCKCSYNKIWQLVIEKLPILRWMPSYKWKEWLKGDIIAGITVAIMHIPLGMAFALLAHLPPIVGIYMAFYQVLIYAFFGTSHHCSMGAFAVITLMTGKVVKELATFGPEEQTINGNELFVNITENPSISTTYSPVQVATVVCFMTGTWQLLIGALHLGSCSVFLSDMFVSGFTTATAVHVFTSQIKDMFGLTVVTFSGPFKIIYNYIEIFRSLGTIGLAPTLITLCAVTFLVTMNDWIKPKLANKIKVLIPSELFVVIGGTVISSYGYFNEKFGVEIVGTIPTGLPSPDVPPLELMGTVAVDSFVIAMVSFAIDFSIAKIFALKRKYKVDATQELYAHAISNIGSSFFSCPPMSGALGRSIVQDAVGGVTQVTSFVCCGVILIILLFIGHLFEPLPKAILASVIAVAIKGMFLQVRDVVNMWNISKLDASIWLVSFFSTVIIDIDFGLLIGILFSIFVLLVRNQSQTVLRLGKVAKTDLYLDMKFYNEAKKIPGCTILRIVGSINFANRENLKCEMMSKYTYDTNSLITDIIPEMKKEKEVEYSESLIVDFSGISYVDTAGAKYVSDMKIEFGKNNVSIYLVGISDEILETLNRCKALEHYTKFDLYHSIHDALTFCTTVD